MAKSWRLTVRSLASVKAAAPGWWPSRDGPGRRNAVCYRRPRRGNCKAIHRRWFFNYRTLMCDRFLWGGCDTNGNNFNTRRDCRLACTPTTVVQDGHHR
ncbi:hypothetical protein HPB47_009651 [Ixodes persulcatus]|uniref:Uncharacterized protein n=1 Tax=Ixodes persulcatus TaxID=34615 RepID=A0AC60P1L7_IXOPE|nr:hypothetical protein HPB47_009651 [Ixodes persulcatus]